MNKTIKTISFLFLISIFSLRFSGNLLALPGDVNENCWVNYSDFLLVSSNYGKTVNQLDNPNIDADGDGIVGFSDFILVSSNYGRNSVGDITINVPEAHNPENGPLEIEIQHNEECQSVDRIAIYTTNDQFVTSLDGTSWDGKGLLWAGLNKQWVRALVPPGKYIIRIEMTRNFAPISREVVLTGYENWAIGFPGNYTAPQ